MADPPSPNLTDRIDLYLILWETVGDAPFTVDGLKRAVRDGPREQQVIGADRDLQAHLETLVAAGLLDWHGDDRYQIRLTPEHPLDVWHERTAARISDLYETIEETLADREGKAPATDERDVVRFEGETYVRTTVPAESTFEEVAADLATLVGPGTEHDTAVLCVPADEADRVQRFADRLCDAETMADFPRPTCYEKVTTQVLGADPDDLEYRMYLARSDASRQ